MPDRGFLDLFSRDAGQYAASRPRYPDALYELLVGLVPRRSLAWDCATGNGQAARDLARYVDRVIATDASPEQIALAVPVSNVEYRVARAEASGLPSGAVDLVTVAQALHWLDLDAFYTEVRRVTVPQGVIAAWCYGYCHAGADLEGMLREFEEETLGPYWDPRRQWVIDAFRTIPFPFVDVPMPRLELRMRWTLRELGAYLSSWSAVSRFRLERGEDPVAPLLERMERVWRSPDQPRDITWPLGLRVGRMA